MTQLVASIYAAIVAVTLAAATPALGEPLRFSQAAPGPMLPPFEIISIIRSMDFQPIGRPARRGTTYLLRAIDPYGDPVTLVIDARRGRILSMTPAYMPPPYYALPARPVRPGQRWYGPRILSFPDDDEEFDEPRVTYGPGYPAIPSTAPPPVAARPAPARPTTIERPLPRSRPAGVEDKAAALPAAPTAPPSLPPAARAEYPVQPLEGATPRPTEFVPVAPLF